MMSIKLQCACGQKFVFDVEPVNGHMPTAVKCPACGRDATQAANEEIAKRAPAPLSKVAPKKRRWPWVVGICGGALLLLLAMGGVLYWWLGAQELSQPPPTVSKPTVVTGIGLYVVRDQETRQWVVTRTFPDSPAAKAEIPAGLILNKVDGILAEEKTIGEVSALLRGPVGTKVTLEFIDPKAGKTNVMELTRDTFDNRSK